MKRNRIFIDGLGIVEGHFSGVGQYILGIVRGLDDILEEAKYTGEPVPEVFVIIPYDSVKKFKKYQFKNVRYRVFPVSFRAMSALWRRRWLPPMDLLYGRGTYIFPRFVSMPLAFSKSILVIFDLSYELYRQYSDEQNAIFLSKQVKKSLEKTKKLITISDNAKKEIVDFYKVPVSSVKVATPAADQRMFYRRSQREIDEVKTKYEIEGDYILALSNLEPRKNLNALVDAYCALPKKYTDKVALLLVGVSGWKTEELFNKIVDKVEEGYNIIRPSKFVKDEDKPAIISGAKVLVYPSHYEGFGMPPVEALACGTPVIAADNSSLPQAVGKAGVLLPIDDNQKLQKTLLDFIENPKELSEKTLTAGPAHARNFSWQKSSQVFLDSVKELNS